MAVESEAEVYEFLVIRDANSRLRRLLLRSGMASSGNVECSRPRLASQMQGMEIIFLVLNGADFDYPDFGRTNPNGRHAALIGFYRPERTDPKSTTYPRISTPSQRRRQQAS